MPVMITLPGLIDSLNEKIFRGQSLSPTEKETAVNFLLSRQASKGKYSGLILPTRQELQTPIHLFTGERLHTHLGPRNVFSAESGRACLLLGLSAPGLPAALELLQGKLYGSSFSAELCIRGECAHSAIGFMRYLAAGGAPNFQGRLVAHLEVLREKRDGLGGWANFPYYYTLLALTEIDLPAAEDEIRYAASKLGSSRRFRPVLDEKYRTRRQLLLERILTRC